MELSSLAGSEKKKITW